MIEAMERFSESEPTALVIAWRDEANNLHAMRCTTGTFEAIALCEVAKQMLIKQSVET